MSLTEQCHKILENNNVDANSKIEFEVNEQNYTLSFTYIIESFMLSSTESQKHFYLALQESSVMQDEGIEKFFESMGQLLLMTHLSNKIEV
jgi:hypothetical protein